MIKKYVYVFLLGILLFGVPINNINADTPSEDIYQSNIEISVNDYNDNVKDLKKISFEQLTNMYNNGLSFYIYIGRPSCPHCRALSPIIREVNIMKGYKIYYYDTDGDDFNSDAKDLIYNKIQIPGVPSVISIKNREVISGWVGDGISAEDLSGYLIGNDENSYMESRSVNGEGSVDSENELPESDSSEQANKVVEQLPINQDNRLTKEDSAGKTNKLVEKQSIEQGNKPIEQEQTDQINKYSHLPETAVYKDQKIIFGGLFLCMVYLVLIMKKVNNKKDTK